MLIDMGISAVAIADRVGHESIDITYRYAHLFPTKQAEMADKLDNANAAFGGGEAMANAVINAMDATALLCPPENGYTYFMPSPTPGKRLFIQGWYMPLDVALMVTKIWNGENTVSDFPGITEIDDFW